MRDRLGLDNGLATMLFRGQPASRSKSAPAENMRRAPRTRAVHRSARRRRMTLTAWRRSSPHVIVVLMLAYSPMHSFGSFGQCERRDGRRLREAAQVGMDAVQKRGSEVAVASPIPTANNLHLAMTPAIVALWSFITAASMWSLLRPAASRRSS